MSFVKDKILKNRGVSGTISPKFRGKSIAPENKGEWVYGHLIIDGEDALILNGIIEVNDQYVTIGEWCSVDMSTIGKSIDMFDKNGQEVFDGDILYYPDQDEYNYGLIQYDKNRLAFVLSDGYEVELYGDFGITHVVGNIYDTPSLLEQMD